MKKYIITLFAAITLALTLAGCQTEAQKVSQNLSLEADNFNYSTVEELVKTLYSNSLVMCPEHYGETIVVNMRNVETITVRKMEE